MKLKAKINVYTAGLFILLLIVINTAIYFSFNQTIYTKELKQANAETIKTVQNMNDSNENIKMGDLLKAYLPVNGVFKLIDQDGQSITTVTAPSLQHLKEYQTGFYVGEKQDIIKIDEMPYAFISIPVIMKNGSIANLQLIESLEETASVLNTLKLVLLIATVLAMIPVFLSTQILSKVISKPILSIIATMGDIQKSGKHKQIPISRKSKDELFEMSHTFNTMIDQLQRNYEKQELFVMNASHELKTPLTIIESYSDLLKRRGLQQPKLFEESVEAIHSEAVRMREMTQQLLLLARSDASWGIDSKELDIAYITEEVTRKFQSGFECDIALTVEKQPIVLADEQKLKQLLYVFIENACKYSEGQVYVKVGVDNDRAMIEVSDDGEGIPKEDLPKIFDRFYRVDQARTRKTGGFGLGLAMAQELADAMDIDLQVESEVGIGTTVKMYFS